MKTIPKIGAALLLAALAFSCKQAEATATEATSDAAMTQEIAPNASKTKVPERKLVRTADIKFKVKDVAQSTYAIENAVNRFGGLIVSNNLQSQVGSRTRSKISRDSIVETTRYTVENNLTLRIPNTALDTVVKTITKEVDYLDYRVLKADDVALRMLSNQLTQQRNDKHNGRLSRSIDEGKKLNQIAVAEDNLLGKDVQSDQAAIENLSLQDQVNYSTVTLALYQNESMRQEMLAIEKTAGDYGNFGLEILDGLKTGWYILERIIAFIVRLWSVILIGGIVIFIFRRWINKKKPAIF